MPKVAQSAKHTRFISEVDHPKAAAQAPKQLQKQAFTKQKSAHKQNMDDVMYRVHLRDSDFMKAQTKLQIMDASNTNIDPMGKFEFQKHHDFIERQKRHGSVKPRKMEHLLPTQAEQDAYAKA